MGFIVVKFFNFCLFTTILCYSYFNKFPIDMAFRRTPYYMAIPVLMLLVIAITRGKNRLAVQFMVFGVIKAFVDGTYHLSVPGRMDDRIAIVTGANSGIGEDLTLRLVERGATVIMACRSLPKCELSRASLPAELVEKARCAKLDLSDFDSVKIFANEMLNEFDETGIDYLVNNGGGVFAPGKTKQGFEMNLGVMHFGHYLLTKLLTPLLKNAHRESEYGPARVVNHASIAGVFPVLPIHESVFIGDGEGSLRGEIEGLNGCSLDWADTLESNFKRICPIRGGYGYAKMWQIGITPMQQVDFDSMPGRRVITSSIHPGIVQSKVMSGIYNGVESIEQFADFMRGTFQRPTHLGSSVLVYALLDDTFTPGSFLDDHYGAHDFTQPPEKAHPFGYSKHADGYRGRFPNNDPTEGLSRMREISNRIVKPYL